MGFSIQDLIGLVILAALIATPVVLWKRKRRIVAVGVGILIGSLWIIIALPSFEKAHGTSDMVKCVNNLIAIRNAKDEWAKQNNKQPSDIPLLADVIGVGKQLESVPICPAGGRYAFGAVGQKPVCSLAGRGHTLDDAAP